MKAIKILLIVLMSTTSLRANTTKTNEKENTPTYSLFTASSSGAPTCDTVLDACGKALEALLQERNKQAEIMELQKKLIEEKTQETERVRRAYDNRISPWIWVGVGIIGGAAGAVYLSK